MEPDNQDQLREAKRRLCALFNVESDESLLLNQFIEERLEAWVKDKESLAKTSGKKRERTGEPEKQ